MAKSIRMTPNSATGKLESAPEGFGAKIPVSSGSSVDVSVWIKKSDSSGGYIYNGNQPRLIQRANAALGQPADVVLATATETPTINVLPATWDPYTSLLVTMSNGNLTVTGIGAADPDQGAHVAFIEGAQTTGKYYFEVKIDTMGSGVAATIGVATIVSTISGLGAFSQYGTVLYTVGGAIYSNNVYSGMSTTPPATGLTFGFAYDLTARKTWIRNVPSGLWNGLASGSQNPSTPVGGATVPAGTMVPFCTFGGSGGTTHVQTANFGGSSFIGAVPTGYTSGWPSSIRASDWFQLSGTSSVATDDGVWEFIVDCDGTVGWINIDKWAFTGAATTSKGMNNWYGGTPVVKESGGTSSGYFSGGFL